MKKSIKQVREVGTLRIVLQEKLHEPHYPSGKYN